MLTKGQRTAGKPNWARKDYQVMAETCAEICNELDASENERMIIERTFVLNCGRSAGLTPSGNRNFNEAMFRAEVQSLLENG